MIVAVATLLAGCNDWQDAAGEGDAQTAGDKLMESTAQDGIAMRPDEGLAVTPVDLPEDFPRDVPIYEGATITSSAVEGNGYYVELLTDDDTWRVMSFYHKRLREFGWRMGRGLLNNPGEVSAQKESRLLTLVCRESPGQTRLMLTVADISSDRGS